MIVLPPVVLDAFEVRAPVGLTPFQSLPPVTFAASAARAGLWTGYGVPGTIIGASPGDEYLDLDTGDLYELT